LVREHEPLSGFLLQFALYETMMNLPYGAFLQNAVPGAVERLTGLWSPLPWAPWHWPNDSTRFFVAPGLIATVSQDTYSGCTVMARAVHRSLVEVLEDSGLGDDDAGGAGEQDDSDRSGREAESLRWGAIDSEIFAGRKIRAIQLIREAFGGGIHEALDMLVRRYDGLRLDRPGRFETDAETYWDGFYS
jgi:hypothetical protein